MPIVINGSGTVTGVTNVGSAAANTAVVLQDSGSNTNTCRAWVNFNGTGTVAIRASFNVTSITDNGVGNYTVNFTTAMPDTNYAFTGGVRGNTGEGSYNLIGGFTNGTNTTSAFQINTWNTTGTGTMADRDFSSVYAAFFR